MESATAWGFGVREVGFKMSRQSTSMSSGSLKGGGLSQFGIRRQESGSSGGNSPLKVSKDSHRIRKPPLPLPQVQYRPPVIIHTYSPKVIHTQPDDFMSLVQKLTGSSDTRLRLKKSPALKKAYAPIGGASAPSDHALSAAGGNLERQGRNSFSFNARFFWLQCCRFVKPIGLEFISLEFFFWINFLILRFGL